MIENIKKIKIKDFTLGHTIGQKYFVINSRTNKQTLKRDKIVYKISSIERIVSHNGKNISYSGHVSLYNKNRYVQGNFFLQFTKNLTELKRKLKKKYYIK